MTHTSSTTMTWLWYNSETKKWSKGEYLRDVEIL